MSRYAILIIDDNEDDRDHFRRILKTDPEGDYAVTEARDGAEGLKQLAGAEYDCVLLDYSLPGANGLDVLRAIRAEDPHLAVIMLTGQGDINVAVQSLKESANDYLTKSPEIAGQLQHAIRMAMGNAVNARKAANSERYLRQVLDHVPDPIFMKDENHRWVGANAAFWAFMKARPEQFVGKTDHDIFPLDLADLALRDEQEVFRSRQVIVREEEVADMEGRRHRLVVKKGVFQDPGNRPRMVGVVHDITALKAQQAALEASERTFRQAIDHAVNPMALAAPDGRWKKVNRALCRLLGHDREVLLANDIASVTHPDDREEEERQLEGIWDEEEGARQYEKRYYHRAGHVITVLQSVSTVRQRDGAAHYLVVQMMDLTESRKIDRMKSEFISTVSHELRTPLTSIRGSLGLIAQPFAAALTPAGQELIDIAGENCERLIALINDILDIDKIANGEMRLHMEPHDLADMLDRAVKGNAAYAGRFRVELRAGAIPPGWVLTVDDARFLQIMSNLISNAVKFSGDSKEIDIDAAPVPDDGGTAGATDATGAVGADPAPAENGGAETGGGARVRIRVTDHGNGIPEEFRTRIFGKFAQADSSVARARNGTGLGLHISRQLVEAMGGRIGFDTETGVGTTFWIEFPMTEAADGARSGSSLERAG